MEELNQNTINYLSPWTMWVNNITIISLHEPIFHLVNWKRWYKIFEKLNLLSIFLCFIAFQLFNRKHSCAEKFLCYHKIVIFLPIAESCTFPHSPRRLCKVSSTEKILSVQNMINTLLWHLYKTPLHLVGWHRAWTSIATHFGTIDFFDSESE